MSTHSELPARGEGATGSLIDHEVEYVATYGDPTAEERALEQSVALAVRTTRDVISVEGPDTWSFLQSVLSADLDPLTNGEGVPSLLLTPQGKLSAHFLVLRISATDAWLVVETGRGAELLAALDRFRIRVAVDLVDRSDTLAVISVMGPSARRTVAQWAAAEVPKEPGSSVAVGRVRFVSAPWPGMDAIDCIGRPEVLDGVWRALRAHGAVPVGHEVVEAARIRAGVPRLGVDVGDKTIPQEAFLDREAVSFTKGCFIGQELVCRIDTRGHVNKYLRVIDATSPLTSGTTVTFGDGEVGTVTSTAVSPGVGPVGLATIRREVEPGSTVAVDGVLAHVLETPLAS